MKSVEVGANCSREGKSRDHQLGFLITFHGREQVHAPALSPPTHQAAHLHHTASPILVPLPTSYGACSCGLQLRTYLASDERAAFLASIAPHVSGEFVFDFESGVVG